MDIINRVESPDPANYQLVATDELGKGEGTVGFF